MESEHLDDSGIQSKDKKIIALFGHDTNIQFVLQLLGLEYNLHGWPHKSTCASGALLFEVWSNDTSLSKYDLSYSWGLHPPAFFGC